MPRRDWTLNEFEVAIDAYLQMMNFEKKKQRYSKTEIRKKVLANGLTGRSSGSFEYRMQNISSVVLRLGFVPVKGYLPAKNIGNNANLIEEILRTRLGLAPETALTTSSQEQLDDNVDLLLRSGISIGRPAGVFKPAISEVVVHRSFVRSVLVKAWVLQESAGRCEGCDSDAPFQLPSGQPFLEVHHVKSLAEGGADIVENTVALCPNCHRRCHLSADREAFTANLYSRVPRLMK